MAKYRKKPVVIEAIEFKGHNVDEIKSFCKSVYQNEQHIHALFIPTMEGVMTASIGDWIIKGVNGEFYPCKPDIFEKTYEPVNDNEISMENTAAQSIKSENNADVYSRPECVFNYCNAPLICKKNDKCRYPMQQPA